MKRSWNNGGSDHSSTDKLDRKTLEKNRRLYMKGLYLSLFSLIPKDHLICSSKVRMSLLDRLDRSASYIKELQERIQALKKRKKQLAMDAQGILSNTSDHSRSSAINSRSSIAFRLPILELRDLGSALEVILICGLNKNFMFYQIIHVFEEEGAEVVNANFSTAGDKIIHTIHCQVKSSRIGIEISSVCKRLNELVYRISNGTLTNYNTGS